MLGVVANMFNYMLTSPVLGVVRSPYDRRAVAGSLSRLVAIWSIFVTIVAQYHRK